MGSRLERKVAGEKLFNTMKRRLLRKRISTVEALFGASYLLFLGLLALLILAQHDNYDPADRDIGVEPAREGGGELMLYHPPLKRWSEPEGEGAGGRPVDLGILPASLLDGGWRLDGGVESYDPSNLYEKIDGGAELYLAFGFERLDYVTITKGEDFITIELYDQGRFRNSLGIFASQRRPEQAVKVSGAISYYGTPVGFIGRLGEYYFKIAGSSEQEPVLAKARGILSSLKALPARSLTAPAPYALLTQGLGVDPAELEYRRSNVFQYEFADEFWFAPVKGEGKARYFIHESADADSAAALYRRLLDEQKSEYAVIEEDGQRAILKHEYLATFFALSRRGRFLVGVEAAATAETARRHLEMIEEVVESGG